ncbi:hypothetical protein D3C87_1436070 [compost metagenome]
MPFDPLHRRIGRQHGAIALGAFQIGLQQGVHVDVLRVGLMDAQVELVGQQRGEQGHCLFAVHPFGVAARLPDTGVQGFQHGLLSMAAQGQAAALLDQGKVGKARGRFIKERAAGGGHGAHLVGGNANGELAGGTPRTMKPEMRLLFDQRHLTGPRKKVGGSRA